MLQGSEPSLGLGCAWAGLDSRLILLRRANPLDGQAAVSAHSKPLDQTQLDQLCINTIRFLAVDAVQKANSGHPGMPMGAAPIGIPG